MLREIANNLRKLTPDAVEQIALKAVRDNEKEVLNLNKNQLLEGVDSKDSFLMPYASDAYAERKLKLNPLGVTDLKLTGRFYEGFFIQANKFPIYIFSTDDKTRSLFGKYGADIFGLDEKSLADVSQNMVLPALQLTIKKAFDV